MHELDGNSNNGRLQCCACAAESTQFIESPSAKRAFVAPLPHLVFTPSMTPSQHFPVFFLLFSDGLTTGLECKLQYFQSFLRFSVKTGFYHSIVWETGSDTGTLGFWNDPLGPRWLCFTLLWSCKMWITIFTDHLCFCLSGASRKDQPSFTLKQVSYLCERLLKDHEEKIREEYEQILNTKLAGNQK